MSPLNYINNVGDLKQGDLFQLSTEQHAVYRVVGVPTSEEMDVRAIEVLRFRNDLWIPSTESSYVDVESNIKCCKVRINVDTF